MTALILYSRSYCHLCDEMLDALAPLRAEFPFQLDVIDIDGDPLLVSAYDELVPVLVENVPGGLKKVLCHYFLDEPAVRRALSGFNTATDDQGQTKN